MRSTLVLVTQSALPAAYIAASTSALQNHLWGLCGRGDTALPNRRRSDRHRGAPPQPPQSARTWL